MGFVINSIVTVNQSIGVGDIGVITGDGGIANAAVTMGSLAAFHNVGFVSHSSAAVIVNSANAYIENHGSLTGGGGIGVIDAYTGIVSGASYLQLVNYGSISTRGSSDASCVVGRSGGNVITNLGSMISHYDSTIELYDELTLNIGNRVINHGYIGNLDSAYAIEITGNGGDRVINAGTIEGGISLSGGFDVVRNSGTIDGSVQFGGSGGSNTRNSGVITGSLNLTSGADLVDLRGGHVLGGVTDYGGDDTYYVSDSLLQIDDISGINDQVNAYCDFELSSGLEVLYLYGVNAVVGVGNDLDNTISGSKYNNDLSGNEGNDTINGYGGNDTISGDTGNDTINGANGDDWIDGGEGGDTISAGVGNDTIFGGLGNDNISTGTGNDVVTGGGGRDQMNDNGGADRFIFLATTDSGTTAGTRDRIGFFDSGEDVIDLSAIDAVVGSAADNAFTLVGALTGTAGQLAFTVSGSDGILAGDVNGDGTADFTIQLTGVTAILPTDLVL